MDTQTEQQQGQLNLIVNSIPLTLRLHTNKAENRPQTDGVCDGDENIP
jgi:hypothetical protein